MKALILAAGLGTRLRPLTDTRPKALIEVDGRTLLDITIDRVIAAGADDIVVNVHHFADQIVHHLSTHHYNAEIKVSDERERLLDTGGGLRQAACLFKPSPDPILIHNVDILHNADLRHFYAAAGNADVLLLVNRRKTSRYLLFNDNDQLIGWTNVTTGEVRSPYKELSVSACRQYAFSGIHCFSPHLLPFMDTFPSVFPIIDFYLKACKKYNIRAYVADNMHILDVGKIASLASAHDFMATANNK